MDHQSDLIHSLSFCLERNILAAKRPDGKFIVRQERRLIAALNRIFKKQMNYVLEELKKVSGFKKEDNAIGDDINKLVNNLPFKEDIAKQVVLYMGVAMDKGGKSIVKKLALGKFGISFSLQNKKAIDYLNAKKSLELSNYRGNIDATTKSHLLKILNDAAKSGQSYQETAKLIMQQGKAGVFSPARGQLIATREIGVGYCKGNDIPIQEFQRENPDRRVEKAWQTVNDDRVTEECATNEDQGWIGVQEKFDSGDDITPRQSNPRCRCFTKYQII